MSKKHLFMSCIFYGSPSMYVSESGSAWTMRCVSQPLLVQDKRKNFPSLRRWAENGAAYARANF